MKFSALITQRYSARKYKDQPVEKEKLLHVLEAGRLAPSAVNFQPWQFLVITKPENLDRIVEVYPRDWIKKAPAIILAFADHSQSWKRNSDGKDFADVDIAIAVDHMTLQAAELGLGTCWVCNFDAVKCARILNLPSHIEPLVMLPLGYPDDSALAKKRKKLEEIVYWETFE
jgi:nitroreductase